MLYKFNSKCKCFQFLLSSISGGRPPTNTLREYFKIGERNAGRNDDDDDDESDSSGKKSAEVTCLNGKDVDFEIVEDDDDDMGGLYLLFIEKFLQPVIGRLTD